MKNLAWVVLALCLLTLARCGGGSSGDPRGDPPGHPLEGVWSGAMFEVGWLEFRIDGWGDVTDIVHGESFGTSFLYTGGRVVPDTDPPRLVLDMDLRGLELSVDYAFLLDADAKHASLVQLTFLAEIIPFGSFERDAVPRPVFYQPDILGAWSGYGYAYSQPDLDFATFEPVDASALDGTPNDRFRLYLPSATLMGDLSGGLFNINFWHGVVDGTNARFASVMSLDKQFVTVMAIPNNITGMHEVSYYALNRNPP